MNASPSPHPLSIKYVIGRSLQLYKSNFKAYLKATSHAVFWSVGATIFFFSLLGLLLWTQSPAVISSILLLRQFIPIALVVLFCIWLLFYCTAKIMMHSAVISRLAFTTLTHCPESVSTATQILKPKAWSFLSIASRTGSKLLALVLALFLLKLVILMVMFWQTANLFSLRFIIQLLVGFPVFNLAINSVALVGGLWIWSRIAFAEVPLAVNPDLDAASSVDQTWILTQGNGWRVAGVLMVPYSSPIVEMLYSNMHRYD